MSLGRRSRTGGNRDRLLDGEVAARFLGAVLAQARRRDLLSDEHFTVDGTLIEAWASHKSFRPKDGGRSEEHTSELQSLMRISYAVFCLKKKTKTHDYSLNTNITLSNNENNTR